MSTNKIIRNIWAVGRNYSEHAKEMQAPLPEKPLLFLKSGSTISMNSLIHLPPWSKEVHHEIELAYWLDENLQFSHVTLALDLTARDAQSEAKKNGTPWTLAKSFVQSCPMGPWISLETLHDPEQLEFELKIDGQTVQLGRYNDMIFKPGYLLQYVKSHFPIEAHDVILTGTPAGVGPLKSGQVLEAILREIPKNSDSQTATSGHTLLTCHWDIG